jgi:hypothetical protein
VESFRLEAIGELHAIATKVFLPFAVTRLRKRSEDTDAVLTVELRDIENGTREKRQLRLFWERDSISDLPVAVQDQTVTEWAALGVACAVIWHFARLRLHATAALGDRMDYWVLRETQEFALEISGTRTADLESLHREKTQQLLANPFGADGYVVVVGFAVRQVIFSFHANDGGPQ